MATAGIHRVVIYRFNDKLKLWLLWGIFFVAILNGTGMAHDNFQVENIVGNEN